MKKLLPILLSALLCFGATIVPDQYDSLFCKANGTTTTFVDSSTANPKTITANGNATQIPVLVEGKPQAMFFNGSTDYVDIANSADFAYGVGAFEIEFSFMTNIAATAQTIIDNRTATADTDAWLVNIINSSGNKLCFTTATTARITGSTTLAINTKYRCKIVGNGGANGARTVIMYLAVGDGDYAQEGSTYTADYNFAKQTLRIGSVKATAGTYYNGWLKNLTLKKATTTVLDMRGNTPATSPLGPAIYFDGTGDYLTTDGSSVEFGTSSHTVEFFVNSSVLNTGTQDWICRNNTQYRIGITGGTVFWFVEDTEIWARTALSGSTNTWYHLAFVRNGNSFQVYKNGIALGSAGTATPTVSITGDLYIGRNSGAINPTTGFMREIRISDTARYTGNFTPSQTGFTVDANTKLYIKGNENNGVTTFVDSETTPKTVTTNGDTKIKYTEDYRSCIFKDETGKFPYPVGSAKVDFFSAFGSGVGYFDGSGDYLSTDDSADYAFGSDPFTLELFIRHNANVANSGLIGIRKDGSNYSDFYTGNSGTQLRFTQAGGSSIDHYVSFTPIVNTWYHVALTRSGSDWKYWVNGTQEGATQTDADAITDHSGTVYLWIGQSASNTAYTNSRMDNIRISKGVARYTATFNPPEDYPKTGSSGRKKSTAWWNFF